jgi:hypothetical protein
MPLPLPRRNLDAFSERLGTILICEKIFLMIVVINNPGDGMEGTRGELYSTHADYGIIFAISFL